MPSSAGQIRLKIGGMKCGGCQAAVTKALQAVDGVIEATVTLEPGSAIVSGSAAPAALITAVESTGKNASLLGGSSKATAATSVSGGSVLAPLSAAEQLVQLVNCGCLFGWAVVGAVVTARASGQKVGALLPLFPTIELGDGPTVWCSGALVLNEAGELAGWNTVSTLVVVLELLCCVEVVRMLFGAHFTCFRHLSTWSHHTNKRQYTDHLASRLFARQRPPWRRAPLYQTVCMSPNISAAPRPRGDLHCAVGMGHH